MNTKNYLQILFLLISFQLFSQKDCNSNNKGLIPLPDLGTGLLKGYTGGLYPNGSNAKPATHTSELNALIQTIAPMDTSGAFQANGKIVMIGVGASNPRTEFNRFMSYSDTFKNINPKLKIINTCIGGQGIQKINTVSDSYWTSANQNLKDSGLSYKQVQLAWVEIDNTQNPDTSFPGASLSLVNDYKALFEVMLIKFPNLKICYLSARGYSGYAVPVAGGVGKGLLYPRDYLSGWANKFFIENELNNTPGYNFKGANKTIPLVTWGSYHWNDADKPRNDGFVLKCDSDIGADGLHLTEMGEWKIGKQIFDFYSTDASAKSWFTKNNFTNGISPAIKVEGFTVFS